MADSTSQKKPAANSASAKAPAPGRGRVEVLKTHKLYIGGAFVRTESGRYLKLKNAKGELIANICHASRKDFRNAVSAAGKALPGWSGKSAFNRSQILYRIAEMLEQRAPLLVDEMVRMGVARAAARREVDLCIDRTVYFAGWCDKYAQIFSSVNPVASAHFNFSVPEPMGVITVVAGNDTALLSLLSNLLPVLAGGNTAVVLAPEKYPLSAVFLSEILNDSDVPGGAVNILTGLHQELLPHAAGHMGVHGLIVDDCAKDTAAGLREQCAENLKRLILRAADWTSPDSQHPYLIMDTQELKTTWHPVEKISGAGSGY
ncbi:MAG: aldehyde dehydrogenase family protein [Verrucomicrobia bacterium]|nr:aldehyde dehydrogenase family protein [Verrucomicrobiota bacterium]MCH8528865.1 aldehyde dehydrogenase family protein [Kiritimatiellia bacterium]